VIGKLIAGVDEVGRGPLAGPVIAAAVVFPEVFFIEGVKDSKRLSESRRLILSREIRRRSRAWAIGAATVSEVEEINVHAASLRAMRRALTSLTIRPDYAFVDGTHFPDADIPGEAIVKADRNMPVVSAASILAKVVRDKIMIDLNSRFPGYGFSQHKGYPTKVHLSALQTMGPCKIHRRSFAPVKAVLEGGMTSPEG
jgi:ribonuclease HII